jgi:hypothetical protein
MSRSPLPRLRRPSAALLALPLLVAADAAMADDADRREVSSRFSVEIPPSWAVTERDDRDDEVTVRVAEMVAGQAAAACLFHAVDAAALFDGRSPAEIAATRSYAISAAGMRTGLPAEERGMEWGSTALSGQPAGLLVTQNQDADVCRMSVMAMTEQAAYFMVCSSHAAEFNHRRPTFEQIIGSFEILE